MCIAFALLHSSGANTFQLKKTKKNIWYIFKMTSIMCTADHILLHYTLKRHDERRQAWIQQGYKDYRRFFGFLSVFVVLSKHSNRIYILLYWAIMLNSRDHMGAHHSSVAHNKCSRWVLTVGGARSGHTDVQQGTTIQLEIPPDMCPPR